MDPFRLNLTVRRSDGQEFPLGGSEQRPENVPDDIVFGTTLPGGFDTMTATFPRDARIAYRDQNLFDEIIVRGAGAPKAYEGYNMEMPGRADDRTVQLSANGWSASMKDDPSYREIIIDRSLANWRDASNARKAGSPTFNYAQGEWSAEADVASGVPQLRLSYSRLANTLGTILGIVEVWFDAQGIDIGYCMNDFAGDATATNNVAGLWLNQMFSAYDDAGIFGFPDLSGNLGVPSVGAFVCNGAGRKYIGIQLYFNNTFTGDSQWHQEWRKMAIVGRHGMTRYGSDANQESGFLASDIVANIISRAAPMLRYSTGSAGSIVPTTWPIPHLTFYDPVDANDGVSQANKFDLQDWGVYDDREFFYRAPSGGRLWVVRADGTDVTLKDQGVSAEESFNGVLVEYTDPVGITRTIGPTGASNVSATSSSLVDSSDTNPVNIAGRRRWAKLSLSQQLNQNTALQLAVKWLGDSLALKDRGTSEVTGWVRDDRGNRFPAYMIRAGDRIRYENVDSRERRIIQTSYSSKERKNSLTLDSKPDTLEAQLDRIGASLSVLGVG